MRQAILFTIVSGMFSASTALAETAVTFKEMHICCGACVDGIKASVSKIDGVELTIDKDNGTTTVKAADEAAAKKAIKAIARAGFHGVSDQKKFAMPKNSRVKPGKVTRLELVGIHNCCGGCNKAIKDALASVDGVTGDTATAKKRTLVVEGNFDGEAVIKALNKAGFHARLKGDNNKKKKKKKD